MLNKSQVAQRGVEWDSYRRRKEETVARGLYSIDIIDAVLDEVEGRSEDRIERQEDEGGFILREIDSRMQYKRRR